MRYAIFSKDIILTLLLAFIPTVPCVAKTVPCVTKNKLATKTTPQSISSGKLTLGAIQFPSTIAKVPTIRIYYGGHKIATTPNNETKQLTFSIPKGINQNSFYLLVTEAIDFSFAKNKYDGSNIVNTINYLKVFPHKPYRLFKFTIHEKSAPTATTLTSPSAKPALEWIVEECTLTSADLRIPDMAIVVCYNPNFIDSILPKSGIFSLPTITLKQNMLELTGSEAKLHDISDALIMACINTDTIHATLDESIKREKNYTLIAAPMA